MLKMISSVLLIIFLISVVTYAEAQEKEMPAIGEEHRDIHEGGSVDLMANPTHEQIGVPAPSQVKPTSKVKKEKKNHSVTKKNSKKKIQKKGTKKHASKSAVKKSGPLKKKKSTKVQ